MFFNLKQVPIKLYDIKSRIYFSNRAFSKCKVSWVDIEHLVWEEYVLSTLML